MYAGACDVIHIAEPVLGGARTLGKLDESSAGARLSAQMRGRVLVFRLLSASSSRVAEVGQFVHEDMSVHSNQRQRSLDMHCLFVYLAYLYYLYSVLSVFCIICMATIWPTNLETVMEKRHALGGGY